MERTELITSKEYWVETLETLQQQGHTDYDIATVIANKMEEAINYTPCCVGEAELLVCSCGSIKVQTTGGSQCPNNRCSSEN